MKVKDHEFTPGPWDWNMEESKHAMGKVICQVYEKANWQNVVAGTKNESDACLIAAAPELLESLERMVRWYGKRGGSNDDLLPTSQQFADIAQAMKIIEKAGGAA